MNTICIAGKNKIAVEAAQYVLANYPETRLVCMTNRNDPGYDTWQPSLKEFCLRNSVAVIDIREAQDIDDLLLLSLEFDRILKPMDFKSSKLYNVHFSMLPKYRGVYTSALPILFGEPSTGVTLHAIDSGIDTGQIVDQFEFEIDSEWTARDLYEKYNNEGLALLIRNIDSLAKNSIRLVPQDEKHATYFDRKSIDYKNLEIDWNKRASEIRNQVRAFTFWEFQVLRHEGLPVISARITTTKSQEKPGSIVSRRDFELIVASKDYDVVMSVDPKMLLIDGILMDSVEKVRETICALDSLDFRDKNGWSPLIIASYGGKYEICEALLEAGADPNFPNFKGTTPIMYSLTPLQQHGNSKTLEVLQRYGANALLTDRNGLSALDYASARGLSLD